MAEPLAASYLEECERRARAFQGAWTGTGGTLAADVIRLLGEVRRLQIEIAYRDELRRPLPALSDVPD